MTKIIQIRGTSGSGKSWVINRIMERTGTWLDIRIPKRKQPLYYARGGVVILGHYNTACGGCDTIGSARAVFELIQEIISEPDPPRLIICEGLLLSEDVKWTSQLKNCSVLYLTTSLQRCLDQIRSRRIMAGNTKPLNEKNTTNRTRVIERSRVKLLPLGLTCRRLRPRQAVESILKELHNAR